MEENKKKTEQQEPAFIDVQTYKHQGKREYQEDHCDWDNDYLIVADGVGGLAKGDVASKLVITHTAEFIERGLPPVRDIEEWTQQLADHIIAALNEFAANNEETYGMGSTMVLALKVSDYLCIVHVGDSRAYHFSKNGEIKWCTKDHSLVQELLDADIISEEEAETHPRRNVISKVLQAKDKKAPKPSITIMHNFSKGDKLLLCSDGVTESWTRKGLTGLFSEGTMGNSALLKEIEDYAAENSSDNNTAILASIGWTGPGKAFILPGKAAASASLDPSAPPKQAATEHKILLAAGKNKSKYRYLIFVSFFLITFLGIYWAGNYFTSTEDELSPEATEQKEELNKNEEFLEPAETEKSLNPQKKTEEQSSEIPPDPNSSPDDSDTTSAESIPPPADLNDGNDINKAPGEVEQNEEIDGGNRQQDQK